MKKYFDKALALYCVLGVVNFVVCTAIMYLLYNLHICGEFLATLINYALGSLIWYFGCLKLVFPDCKQDASLAFRFVVEVVACYLVSFYVLTPPISHLISAQHGFCTFFHMSEVDFAANCDMTIGVIVYAVVNYFGQRYYVFADSRKKSAQSV